MRIFISVLLLLGLALTGCESASAAEKENQVDLSKKAKAVQREENLSALQRIDPNIDAFEAFVGRLKAAVAAHDVNTLAAMMTPDFGYSLKPIRSGDGVFKYWDDQNLWPKLSRVLAEKFAHRGQYMVAPGQFVHESQKYHGYWAGIRQVSEGHSNSWRWEFAFFVNS
jgi:hypothetical protein